MLLRPLEAGTLEDTIQRARGHVDTRLPGHRNGAGFDRMLILPVTATRSNMLPAVAFQKSYEFANLHDVAT